MRPDSSRREADRLAELAKYRILDTPTEQIYDDFTLIAATIASTPIALISLVDDQRQWFKAHRGLEVRQTDREHAFCARAIADHDRPMMVSDARLDPRFAGNPLVTGSPHIRFYLGVPLVSPNRQALGTLCVIDRLPRELGDDQIAALVALSRQVVAQLELRLRDSASSRAAGRAAGSRRPSTRVSASRAVRQRTGNLGAGSVEQLRGVLARALFEQRLAEEAHRAQRYRTALSLLMIDVDRMSSYNTEFGLAAGDLALQTIAQACRRCRAHDVIGRYGGDGLAVILPETAPDAAYAIGERLREAVASAPVGYRSMTISVGAATLAPGHSDPTELVAQADRAMNAAKQAGRNRVIHAATIPYSTYLSASEV